MNIIKKTDADSRRQSSAVVETLFADAITRVKERAAQAIAEHKANSEAQAQQAIAKIKLTSEVEIAREKARVIDAAGRISKVKAEAEENEKALAENVTLLKTELAEKQKNHAEQIAKIKAETEKLIADIKTEHEQNIAKINAEHDEQISKIKAEAQEAISKVQSEVLEKEKEYDETITKIKTEAEEKIKEQTEQITQIKPQAEEKQKADEEEIDKIKAEADKKVKDLTEQITQINIQVEESKKVHEEQISKIKAESEEKEKGHDEEMARVKAETEERTKALTEQIAKIKAETTEKQKAITITESEKSAQSPPELPRKWSVTALAIYAKDIMQKEPVWGSPEDSVQEILSKMKQQHTGYMMIGTDGVLEGIVSKSDLNGAVSPYLRPEFAKWRRPLDDATLKLKVKWIMSRPVHIISSQTPLAAIMSSMCRFRVRALPMVNQQGKVLGLVTEADIFKAILKAKSDMNIGVSDKSRQAKSTFPKAPERSRTQPAKENQPSLVPA